jgi:hypothetical protein
MAESKLIAKQPGETSPGKAKGLIFGGAGVGKTWFSLSFPAPYYFDCEGGADLRHYQERLKKNRGVYVGPDGGALDFDVIIGQIKALATETHPYKTVIIDSVTKLFQIAIANEAERLGARDAFGASKKPAIAKMRQLVNWIQRLDMNVWFIAHEITEWGQSATTGQREEVGKMADVWDKLNFEFDLVIRVIRCGKDYPAIGSVNKSRLIGFPLYDTFPLEYGEFATRYGKDFIEAATTTVALATPEQVAEIVRLAEILKITEEESEKVLTKAKAASWSELAEEQATKTLEWLNQKINPAPKAEKKGKA